MVLKADAEAQETQYSYPYHYLPRVTGDGFNQVLYWSWGYRYLGRLKVVFELLDRIEFHSLLDIGCGDGRFLREASLAYPNLELAGIDSSERAVTLAKQINPGLKFKQQDILDSPLETKWDVITLLEVIEHISPSELPDFMMAACGMLNPGGHLVITVPHLNEKLIPKHFQHFTLEKLRALLPPGFEETESFLFDRNPPSLRLFLKLMGGSGRFYVISHQGLNNLLYNYYIKKCLYSNKHRQCKKIAFMSQKSTSFQVPVMDGET
jgi:2-polyprenyl-3-methyl-5-hydroxy-6-metoxy-1,4-benzoquinol methylase